MLFPATTLLVKMCLERSAERDKHENKNKISAVDGQSECGGHFKWSGASSCPKATNALYYKHNNCTGFPVRSEG